MNDPFHINKRNFFHTRLGFINFTIKPPQRELGFFIWLVFYEQVFIM